MNSITLTKEHKSKLLEMCKVLFPEYKIIKFSTDHNQFEDGDDNNILLFFSGKIEVAPSIHWFEFCSRYLMMKLDDLYFEKIIYPVDPYHKQNHGKNLKYPNNWHELWRRRPFLMFTSNLNGTHYKKHPIDYLYQEFKELKNK